MIRGVSKELLHSDLGKMCIECSCTEVATLFLLLLLSVAVLCFVEMRPSSQSVAVAVLLHCFGGKAASDQCVRVIVRVIWVVLKRVMHRHVSGVAPFLQPLLACGPPSWG